MRTKQEGITQDKQKMAENAIYEALDLEQEKLMKRVKIDIGEIENPSEQDLSVVLAKEEDD